jgi:WD40 repeat protein
MRVDAVRAGSQPRSVAWNPSGDRLAVGFFDGSIVLYRTTKSAAGTEQWEEAPPRVQWMKLHKPNDLVLSLDWAKGTNVLAAASSSGTVGVFNVSPQSQGNIMYSHKVGICSDADKSCPAFSAKLGPDGYLAASSKDGTASVMEWKKSGNPFRLPGGGSENDRDLRAVTDVAWSPDGGFLATATGNGVVRIWDWQQRDYVAVMKVDGGGETRIAWDPARNDRIATASRDGIARTWTWQRFDTPAALLGFVQKFWEDKLKGSSDALTQKERTDLGIPSADLSCRS